MSENSNSIDLTDPNFTFWEKVWLKLKRRYKMWYIIIIIIII